MADEKARTLFAVTETKFGIPWCINCIGFNPNDAPSLADFWERLHNPNRAVLRKHKQHAMSLGQYTDKSCMMCGRSYDHQGELDETFALTAKRVREEFQNAGVFGVDDLKIEMVVAQCRKSFTTLLANRFRIPRDRWQYLTFSGQLAYIITVAQETKKQKFEGMVQL